MGIRARAFSGTPESAALLQPWVGVGHPQPYGILLGFDLRTGSPLVFDPWLLREKKVVSSLMTLVIGQKEVGKTTLAMVLGMRLGALAAQNRDHIRIRASNFKSEDGKAEYNAMTDFFGSKVINLAQERINIFDVNMFREETELLDTVVNVCEFVASKPLDGYQHLAIQVGVFRMLRDYRSVTSPGILETLIRRLDERDVNEYFRASDDRLKLSLRSFFSEVAMRKATPDEANRRDQIFERLHLELERPSNLNVQQFKHDASMVASYLGRVLRGDMGNMFGGSNSLTDILRQPSTTFDWSGLNSRATSLMRSILWKAQTVALARNDLSLIPHIDVDEEDHARWQDLIYARYKAEFTKIARAFPTINLAITHRLGDYYSVGSAGSEVRALATNMINDVDMFFIGRQVGKPDDIRQRLDQFSSPDLRALNHLKMGQFAMVLGERKPIFFQLVLSVVEKEIVRTNRANEKMINRIPVLRDAEVQRRLAQGNGTITMIGE